MSSTSQITVRVQTVFVIIALTALGACGHDAVRRTTDRTAPETPRVSVQSVGDKAVAAAMGQLGVPYRYGGASADGFDCSGLVQFAYRAAGVPIPRTTRQQWRQLAPVAASNIAPGDLLFFEINGSVSHVGLFIGRDRFVHAPASGRTVSVASLNSAFYRRAFVRAARP